MSNARNATQALIKQGIIQKHQRVVFETKAHEKLLEGATILADAVRSTMGPSGHNVIIDTDGAPLITKDGVTVARSINLKDKLPSIGAELIKEVASKTNELCGDGTSTATVLAHAMLKNGIKMISTGRSSIGIKKGMDLATEAVIKSLKEKCIQVRNAEDIINVGTISANGDRKIGELISEAINKVSQEGIITIEPGKSTQTTLEIVEGMQLDSGYASPYFVNKEDKVQCELINPVILITNKKISSLSEILSLLETVVQENKQLLIVADDVEGEALHTLIVNKFKGSLISCVVKAPSYGENRTDILADLGIVTGGHVFDTSSAISFKNIELGQLGTCKKVIVTRTNTILIGEQNQDIKTKIEERVNLIRNALNDMTLDELRTSQYRKRLAKLAGGVAVIKVGGSTEVEIFEKKDRVEDALNATMAAVQEGIVPGGGCALFYASQDARKELDHRFIFDNPDGYDISEDEWAGIEIILKACESPLITIVENTGKSAEVVMDKLLSRETTDNKFGYDAAKSIYGDLVEKGIIDPVKVTRYSLEHASSVVGLMLTSNCVIYNEESSFLEEQQ